MASRIPVAFLRTFGWCFLVIGIGGGGVLIATAVFQNMKLTDGFGFSKAGGAAVAFVGILFLVGGLFWWSLLLTIAIAADAVLDIKERDHR